MSITDALLIRRRRLLACGSLLVMGAGVVAYRTYSGKEPVAGWSYLLRVRKALRKYSEAFLLGSDISSLLLRDMQTFLASDAQELPQSFKQLLRVAQSQEFQKSTTQLVTAAVKGVMEGSSSSESGSGDFLEKLIAAFSTDKGSNLLTLAISVACKSSTTAWCEHQARQDAASAEAGRPDSLQRLFDFAGTREGYHLTQSSIRTCVREGTSVYMDKLEGTNSYADMLEAIRRPGNGAVADRLTKVFVREMVTSYFQKPQQEGNAIHISSSKVEDVTHTFSTQRPSWQTSTCAADAECQLSSSLQQPCRISSPAGVGAAVLGSGGRPAVLPLVADATASSASLAADTAPQSGSPQLQQRSSAKHSRDEQQSSSTHWAQQVIKVVKVPEARMLLLSLAAISSAQGVRGAFLAVKDVVFGEANSSGQLQTGILQQQQKLYVAVGVTFLIVLFFARMACDYIPGSRMTP